MADFRRMDRARQSALAVQRRAQSGDRFADPGDRAGACLARPRGGARPSAPAVAGGYDNVAADDTVPGAALRASALRDGRAALPDNLPVRAWWPDRSTACDDSWCHARVPGARAVGVV